MVDSCGDSDTEDAVEAKHGTETAKLSDNKDKDGAASSIGNSLDGERTEDSIGGRKSFVDGEEYVDEDSEALVLKLDESNDSKSAVQPKEWNNVPNSASNSDDGSSGQIVQNLESTDGDEAVNSRVEEISVDDTNLNEKAKTMKLSSILDSDSDDEAIFGPFFNSKSDEKFERKFDSDGSDDSSQITSKKKKSKIKKAKRLVNSESEDEGRRDDHESRKKKSETGRAMHRLGSDEDKSSADEGKNLINKFNKAKKISDLIDSESEDDRPAPNYNSPSEDEQNMATTVTSKGKKRQKSEKKLMGSTRASKDEAMRQIHSESQRMLREREISLPYHRPKQRSLQEFLNRKKMMPSLPTGPTTATKVKNSFLILGKALEAKEKEIELFYKSSSDSENEIDNAKTLPMETTKQNPASLPRNIENIGIEETQKPMKNEAQCVQHKKEIIKQGNKDIGVPRKLFDQPEIDPVNMEDASCNKEENAEDGEDETEEDPIKKHKETKQGLKEVSVPRILFGADYDSKMDIEVQMENIDAKFKDGNETGGQSESIDTVIQSLEDVINDKSTKQLNTEQLEASMENDTDDFELKMSEDLFDSTEGIKKSNKPVAQENEMSKNCFQENERISETPFISGKEVAKLNEKCKTLAESTVERNCKGDNVSAIEGTKSTVKQLPKIVSIQTVVAGEPIGHVYGFPLPEFEDDKATDKSKSVKKRILPNLTNIKPKLMGSSDFMIDLSDPVKPNTTGVSCLMERMMKHSVSKKSTDKRENVTVTNTERTADGSLVVKEVVPYKLPVDEANADPELSKPGAKWVRLQEDLKQRMATKRNEEWRQREEELKILDEEMYKDEKSDCETDDEEEVEEELSDSGESEPEEDDIPMKEKKPKTGNPFVEAEAEVSDVEATGNSSDEEDDEEEEDDEGSEEDEDEESNADKPKKLKRIAKAFEDDDSNDSSITPLEADSNPKNKTSGFRRTKTDVDIFAEDNSNDDWLSDTEADLPAYQPDNQLSDARSQACKTPSVSTQSLSLVSPITQLTALNTGLNSLRKDSSSNTNYSPLITGSLSIENTPAEKKKSPRICNSDKRIGLQKKLFDDPPEVPDDEELMNLCSGRFTGIASDTGGGLAELIGEPSAETGDPEANWLNLCSGAFTTQPLDIKKLEAGSTQIRSKESQDLKLLPNPDSKLQPATSTQKEPEERSDAPWTAFTIASSSDEEDTVEAKSEKKTETKKKKKKKKKRTVKKLDLSDDESDKESLSDMDKEIEEMEDEEVEEDEDEDEDDEDEVQYVDYDSEENEVVVVPEKDMRKAAANFLEAEAELSESDWGSDDEDEKGMDRLEYEEGDAEDIDEDQMKDQLGKIHMKQVLDEDQREVRMLQEILLEDGELHADGEGRERKFKWRNIDKFGAEGDADPRSVDEDNVLADNNEEEPDNELEWRKYRREREKLLQDQKKENPLADDVANDVGDSQIFKLGMKALKKKKGNRSDSQDDTLKTVSKAAVPIIRRNVSDLLENLAAGKKPLALLNAMQRGSFLSRGEQSLARLAAMTKQSSDKAILRPKNSRNFVFAHLSPAAKNPVEESEALKMREDEESRNEKFTRKRKPTSEMTPAAMKKAKTDEERSKGKRLFEI